MRNYEFIEFEVDDKVAVVTLNRPEKLNALHTPMVTEIIDVFDEIKGRQDISVVILKAAGRAFSAGADLTQMAEVEEFAVPGQFFAEQRHIFDRWNRNRRMLWELPQPVIAQVQGHALTVGLELAMNCDLVVAAHDAKMTRRSLGGAGLYMHMWHWLIGVRKTKELLFTGRYVSGEEAAALGIVNASVPLAELDDYTMALAREIARVPLAFLAIDKQASNKALEFMGAREGVEYSLTLHALGHTTDESNELVDAVHSGDWRRGVAMRDSRYSAEAPPVEGT